MVGIGVIAPIAVTFFILWYAGVFEKFWFWTINYAREYGTLVPLGRAPRIFLHSVSDAAETSWALWLFAGAGAVAGCWDARMRGCTVLLLAFLFFSGLAVCPGFYFRPHYFILVLAPVSLLAGVAIGKLSGILATKNILIRLLSLLLFALALIQPILLDKKIFFQVSPNEACGIIYPQNPFLESVRIGDYIRKHTEPDDTIAVLGSEPEIYFYSQRHSATGYIYMYSLMEPQRYAQQMQRETIHQIEASHPKYLVFVSMEYSWLRRPASDQTIFDWANQYTVENYNAAGLVNIRPTETDYFFGRVPASVESFKDYILLYERKP
jgi:hypothetical protein